MPTTDIVLHTGRELAVQAEFATAFPAIAPTEESMELMATILGEETLEQRNLPRIKVPPADTDRFSYVVGGKTVTTKTIKGIMVHYVPQRAFWTNPDPTNSPPECASSDNKVPDPGGLYAPNGERAAHNPSGTCRGCPMAVKGSDLKGGRLPACKEQRRLFIVLKGLLLPVILTVPPSSIGDLKDFLVSMAMANQGWWALELEFSLERTVNKGGQAFNVIKVAGAEESIPLGENEIIAAKAYGEYIKELVRVQGVPAFNDQAAGDGFSVGDPEPEAAFA